MGSLIDQSPLVQYHDALGELNGAESMGNDDGGAALTEFPQGDLYFLL